MSRRQHGWLTPDTVTPTGFICRRLLIPDDLGYVMAVNGALLDLTYSYNWEKFGVATPDEAASLMWQMWQDYHSGACMIGAILPYVTSSPPSNTLTCDGAQYNRVDYPVLYGLLDSFFIVDADTFAVPDLRGRTIIGVGQGSGLTDRAMGDTGGEENHQLDISEMPSHSHAYDPVITGDLDVEGPGVPQPNAAQIIPAITENTYATGGDGSHNNMQPFQALNYCIVAR